jgi:hypothetical protein
MPKIKLNADKLVGYTRTHLTETGIAKLGTAKLGCAKTPPKAAAAKRLPVTTDDRA